ncbi:MAG: phosphoglycerate kinase, partial [bacterium]|nr:phosphoglycerate kinase [bacterium]
MRSFLTLADLDVEDRTVLVRSDLNVPIENGRVTDDFRLRATSPTIALLRDAGAAVVVCSHLGRPGGRVDEELRMAPVASALSGIGGFPVASAVDTVGPDARDLVAQAEAGDVVLLENTRFHPGETTNEAGLAAALAELADLFVLDAFGSAHRAHASTAGVTDHLRSAAGPLLVRELEAFRTLMDDPPRPFTVLLGGAKVSDKLPLIRALLPAVDAMLVGGGMCFSLLAADGYEVGDSLVEPDYFDTLAEILRGELGDRLVLPVDIVAAGRFAPDATATTLDAASMGEDSMGLDIGPRTTERFAEVIAGSAAVFWNGPMGVFEWESFRSGTAAVAQAVAASNAFTVAGGGDSVAALRMLGRESDLDHLSTGGGAGLE